ncbi:MAG TPA: uroporphyrinogen decarboxylase family protein [Phycisphaerae bacterium]|nr:uroporphyrinogen decarboxylase family protein [Phycisphaerae bacterium]
MPKYAGLAKPHQPNWQGLVDNILRKGTPDRAYHMELFHDGEIASAIIDRFDLDPGINRDHPDWGRRRYIALLRFLGFDCVNVGLIIAGPQLFWDRTTDTAERPHEGGRGYLNEHAGPITNWEQFEKFQWPDPNAPGVAAELEWYQKNLPDDMGIIGMAGGHYAEWLTWLMGYETLCLSLYDQRDLVRAIADKLREIFRDAARQVLQFDRVKMIWGSDDMGFKTQPLISPKDAREFFLPGHKEIAAMSHAVGRPYLLHACGNLNDIIDDLIDDVKIDAKHSFEDTIEDVRQVKHTYGRRIAMIGGIDVDFLCRADEKAIRKRIRETLEICMPGGGYCLGSGNSVANYIPLDNYLAMVDEGRLYAV